MTSTKLTNAVVVSDGKVTTTSLKIAEVFEKDHDKVIRAIESLQIPDDFKFSNFGVLEIPYKNGLGKTVMRKAYAITRDGFVLLVMGFTGAKAMQFKIAYLEEFNRMESKLRELQAAPLQPELPLSDRSGMSPVPAGPFSALRYQGVEVIPTDELRRRLGITRGQLSGWLNRYNPLVEGADMFQVHGVTDKLALAMIRAGFKVNPNVVAVTLYTRSGFAKAAARFAAGAVPEPDDRGPKLDIPRLDPEKPPVSYTFDASMLPKEPKDFLCYKTLMVLKKAGYDIDREIAELSAFQHMAVSAGVIIRSMLADVQKTLGYMFQNYNRISQRAECTVAGEQVNTKAKTILHPGKEA